MIKILITGANGFIGRNAVHYFARKSGYSVTATDIGPGPEPLYGNEVSSFTYIAGELTSSNHMNVLKDKGPYDCMLHLAAILPQARESETWRPVIDINLISTLSLLEIARTNEARFILPSTALVYGDNQGPFTEDMAPAPLNLYALSKHMAEEAVRYYHRAHGIPYNIFRAAVLYGPCQKGAMFIPAIISSLLAGMEFSMTKGEQVRDFLYIDDFLNIVEKAIRNNKTSGTFNLGSGESRSMSEVAHIVEKLTGAEKKVKIGALPYRDNETWDYRLSNTRAAGAFGWKPETGLEKGLELTAAYHREKHGL